MVLTEEILRENYQQLDYLLLTFSCAYYEHNFDQSRIITNYLYDNFDIPKDQVIQKAKLAIHQAEELLDMEPFPEELFTELIYLQNKSGAKKQWLKTSYKRIENQSFTNGK